MTNLEREHVDMFQEKVWQLKLTSMECMNIQFYIIFTCLLGGSQDYLQKIPKSNEKGVGISYYMGIGMSIHYFDR